MCRRSKVGNHLCPIRVLRLSLTIEVATWPNRPPNAGQRPVSRRQALAYGSSLAAALPPHPPRPLRPRHRRRPPAQHLSVSLAQAKRIVAAAEWRARQIGVSMFIVVVDDCGVIKMSSRMDGNSQASVTVVPPKAVTANAFRTPTATLAQEGRRSDPARLDHGSRLQPG